MTPDDADPSAATDAGRHDPPTLPRLPIPPGGGLPPAFPDPPRRAAGQPPASYQPAPPAGWTAPPEPPRTGPRRHPLLVAAGVIVALALVTLGALLGRGTLFPTAHQPAASAPSEGPVPTAATTTPDAATTPALPPPDPQQVAVASLDALAAQDLQVMTFRRQPVAQLASKSVGIVDPLQVAADGTHTFAATDILAEYQTLRDNPIFGNEVVLLKSTDFSTRTLHNGSPLYVTFAMEPFTSLTDVALWCAQQFASLDTPHRLDACTARTLDPPR